MENEIWAIIKECRGGGEARKGMKRNAQRLKEGLAKAWGEGRARAALRTFLDKC